MSDRILIAACGYENRSIHFCDHEEINLYDKIWVIDYISEGILSYDSNKAKLTKRLPADRANWITTEQLESLILELSGNIMTNTRVEIDCSSMDRSTLAKILSAIKVNSERYASLEILYYPQTFIAPSLTLETVSRFGPISRQFSGSSRSSSEKMCLIMGVGYEFGKAIGAQDYLEPDETYAFHPVGTNPGFEEAIYRANSGFDFVGNQNNVVAYHLLDPTSLLDNLLALIDFKRRTHRVMLLPMGPKIFAAICLVIALRFHPDIRVWRFSTQDPNRSPARDTFPSGERIAIDVLRAIAPFGGRSHTSGARSDNSF